MAMVSNVGGADRVIRVVLGIGLLLFALFTDVATVWRAIVGIVGAIALLTGVVAYCPANQLLGIDTHKKG